MLNSCHRADPECGFKASKAAKQSVQKSYAILPRYGGGVMTGCKSTDIDHAVQAVGYGKDEKSGKSYWLVRNSCSAELPVWATPFLSLSSDQEPLPPLNRMSHVAVRFATNGRLRGHRSERFYMKLSTLICRKTQQKHSFSQNMFCICTLSRNHGWNL